MIPGKKIAKFVERLTELTRRSKLLWVEGFSGHTCQYNGAEIFVSWMSGDRPSISINETHVESLALGIQELCGAINDYYKRRAMGRYSAENIADLKKIDEDARKKEQENLTKVVSEIDKIIKKKK